MKRIELSYRDNFVSFDYAALDYAAPDKNQYAYMMEGVDRDWVYAGTRRHADYPNLRWGNYVFRVKGSNNDGVWNEQGTGIQITITPPFWATWWFRGLVALVVVSSAAGGYGCASRTSRRERATWSGRSQQRTHELAALYRADQELLPLPGPGPGAASVGGRSGGYWRRTRAR